MLQAHGVLARERGSHFEGPTSRAGRLDPQRQGSSSLLERESLVLCDSQGELRLE